MAKDTSYSTGRLTCGYYWHFNQLEEQTKLPPETGTCSLASPNLRTMLGPNSHLPNSYTVRLSCIRTNHPNSLHLSWPPPHENTQHLDFFFFTSVHSAHSLGCWTCCLPHVILMLERQAAKPSTCLLDFRSLEISHRCLLPTSYFN